MDTRRRQWQASLVTDQGKAEPGWLCMAVPGGPRITAIIEFVNIRDQSSLTSPVARELVRLPRLDNL